MDIYNKMIDPLTIDSLKLSIDLNIKANDHPHK